MTLIELQDVLGKQIEAIVNNKATPIEHKKALENAEYIAKIAKQMINSADVVLRNDKMCNRHDRIDKLTGE